MYCSGVSLDRFRGAGLTSVVLRTDLQPSKASVKLTSASGSTTLRLSGVVHARIDISDPEGDFVDEVVVIELPQYGPWPAEAAHLHHHHNNRVRQYWLRVAGPSDIEFVAEMVEVG